MLIYNEVSKTKRRARLDTTQLGDIAIH